MKMKSAIVIAGLLIVLGLSASDLRAVERYEVTITNLTRGQVITPPVVLSHMPSYALFTEGEKARLALATLAESGATGALVDVLATKSRVYDVAAGTGVIPPGQSLSVEVMTDNMFESITAVGMLAQTNDAFFAIKGVTAPLAGEIVVFADAYDAGSEANNEMGAYIPGPPFGGSLRATGNAEKIVHIHAGIHGIGDLMPSMYDWRNPVAKVVIRRID